MYVFLVKLAFVRLNVIKEPVKRKLCLKHISKVYPAQISKNPAVETEETVFVLRINESLHLYT